jgi:hypothetical protein
MASPNKSSSTTGALWVIALSLTVIAACLVVLVTRQQHQREVERAQVEKVPPPPSEPADTRRLPKSFTVSPGKRETPEASPAPETTVRVVEITTPAQPAVVAPAAPEPIVSSGLAPLTYLAATNSPGSPASIKGRVTLNGTPPPENTITALNANLQCGPSHHGPVTTHFFQVSKDGGLADVFVFISRGLKGQKFPVPGTPVALNQKGCFYEPYVFGMMTGQKLVVKNSDKILHNVHIDPNPDGPNAGKAKNVAQAPGGGVISASFPAPEDFLKIRCDVHPWMYAYACVVDNPFFAVTDAQGNFVISNVPPGDYTLTASHRKANSGRGGEMQEITVTAGQTTTANFTIQAPLPDNRIARQK